MLNDETLGLCWFSPFDYIVHFIRISVVSAYQRLFSHSITSESLCAVYLNSSLDKLSLPVLAMAIGFVFLVASCLTAKSAATAYYPSTCNEGTPDTIRGPSTPEPPTVDMVSNIKSPLSSLN
jgi:hypothetical protein